MNRCKKLLTDLRQACCDPQMVRTKEDAATSHRRSMQVRFQPTECCPAAASLP